MNDSTEGMLNVVKDLIPDRTGGGAYTFEITLPNVECTNCTLQLIQMMTEGGVYDPNGDLYYQCADITLSNGATTADAGGGGGGGGGDDAGVGGGGGGGNNGDLDGGCSTGGNAAGLPLALGLLGFVVRRRRRR
jgi:uncharacterized protein (TIGR03382 family)